MADVSLSTEEDLGRISFKDVTWLQRTELNLETALEYFSLSPFYDRTCNNEVLKMQTRYNNLEELHEFLVKMKGIEYDVIHASDEAGPCFVIRKQNRMSTTDIVPITVYYIVEGTIYRAPDFYSVLGSRMATSLFHLDKTLAILMGMFNFQPSKGYSWKGEPEESKQPTGGMPFGGLFTRREIQEIRQRIENLATQLDPIHYPTSGKGRIPKIHGMLPDVETRKRVGPASQKSLDEEKDSLRRKK